jgi:glycerol kinase
MPHADHPSGHALYLTLDQGGHASRALVFDAHGRCLAQASVACEVRRGDSARVEQDPEAIVNGLRDCIATVAVQIGMRCKDIVAAALVTQRSSVVCWDRFDGAALTPVLSWQDRRAQDWLRGFDNAAGRIHDITGLMLSAHYGASKLRWCLDHVPAVQEAAAGGRLACGPLAAFLLFHLLPERPLLIDSGNAARTLLWNRRTRDWDPALAALFGVPMNCLPRCVSNRHAFGSLSVGARTVPLTLCHGDQPAALFAAGRPRYDSVYINIGTGAFVQRLLDRDPGVVQGVLTVLVLDEEPRPCYALEGTVNGAGSALDAIGGEYSIDTAELMAQLPQWLEECQAPPLFLNGVSGLGAPFWVADFASRFIGAGSTAERLVAVVESIVFLLQSNLEAIEAHVVPARDIVVSGGLAMLDGLCRRLASLSGRPVRRAAQTEASARGAAWLLADAPDVWEDAGPGARFTPVDDAALRDRYRRWRAALQTQIEGGNHNEV